MSSRPIFRSNHTKLSRTSAAQFIGNDWSYESTNQKTLFTFRISTEEETEARYEYHDGEVFAMSGPSRPGASRKHSAIATNVSSFLDSHLPAGCRAFDSDLKVYVETVSKGFHPDVSVACQPVTGPEEINAVDNPVLLVEVLSESTSAYDRQHPLGGQKFWYFSQLPSLREYVLIEQDRWEAEVRYRDSAEGKWMLEYYEGEDTEVALHSFGLKLPMKRIYKETDGL